MPFFVNYNCHYLFSWELSEDAHLVLSWEWHRMAEPALELQSKRQKKRSTNVLSTNDSSKYSFALIWHDHTEMENENGKWLLSKML